MTQHIRAHERLEYDGPDLDAAAVLVALLRDDQWRKNYVETA